MHSNPGIFRNRLRTRATSAAAVGCAAVLLGACGASSDDTAGAAPAGAAGIPLTGARSVSLETERRPVLPEVEAVRVATDETVNLRDLAFTGRPTLVWFWAPHCPVCRSQAPDVLEFAARHGAHIQIVGVGAQDDLEQARDFLQDTTTQRLEMTWDRSGKSWIHFAVRSPSTLKVIDAEGKVTRTWVGKFDAEQIRAAAGLH